jgi:hypothetical protein
MKKKILGISVICLMILTILFPMASAAVAEPDLPDIFILGDLVCVDSPVDPDTDEYFKALISNDEDEDYYVTVKFYFIDDGEEEYMGQDTILVEAGGSGWTDDEAALVHWPDNYDPHDVKAYAKVDGSTVDTETTTFQAEKKVMQ